MSKTSGNLVSTMQFLCPSVFELANLELCCKSWFTLVLMRSQGTLLELLYDGIHMICKIVFCLIHASQVYGGGISFVIHPQVSSSSFFKGQSDTAVGSVNVSELSAVFRNCNFDRIAVSTRTINGEITLYIFVQFFFCSH
jgi:hypothetical protein